MWSFLLVQALKLRPDSLNLAFLFLLSEQFQVKKEGVAKRGVSSEYVIWPGLSLTFLSSWTVHAHLVNFSLLVGKIPSDVVEPS